MHNSRGHPSHSNLCIYMHLLGKYALGSTGLIDTMCNMELASRQLWWGDGLNSEQEWPSVTSWLTRFSGASNQAPCPSLCGQDSDHADAASSWALLFPWDQPQSATESQYTGTHSRPPASPRSGSFCPAHRFPGPQSGKSPQSSLGS